MTWENDTAVGGEASVDVTLTTAVHVAATADVHAYVGGIKWPQALVSVDATRLIVTVSAPADPVGWVFAAGETVEVGYTPAGTSAAEVSAVGLFESCFAPCLETVTVWTPSRAANASLGLNDPTHTQTATVAVVIEELDGEQQLAAFGQLVRMGARVFARDAYRPTLKMENLIKRSSGDVYRVALAPSVPNALVIDHCETLAEWLPKPPTLT